MIRTVVIINLVVFIFNCCSGNNSGEDCEYRDVKGFIRITQLDSMTKNIDSFSYYWSEFISSTLSDTLKYCHIKIKPYCVSNRIIDFDTLYSCVWHRLMQGSCATGYIKLIFLPDSCYDLYPFMSYDSLSKQDRLFQ
jgi:hypothetical protein